MEDSRSHSAAVPLNFQPLRSDLSKNLLNMPDSVPILFVTRSARGETFDAVAVSQTFQNAMNLA